jgi:hypothetical protein
MRDTRVAWRSAAMLAAGYLLSSSALQAQTAGSRRESSTALRLGVLAHEHSNDWARSAPVIHCGPAPLTERPGVAAEFSRPRVLPLETAFLDAATAKRLLTLWSSGARP